MGRRRSHSPGARAAFVAVAAALIIGATEPAEPGRAATPAAPVTASQARLLGERAYLYGFPLMEFLRVRSTTTSVACPDDVGDAPLNTFSEGRRTAGPADRTVVAPNVDTLYSIAELDLARGPVVLSHPDMGRRYFVFELLDPYTNVIGYVGSRTTGSRAGRFAITWTARPGQRVPGARVIDSSYRRVWVIGRTLVRGPGDRRRAIAAMSRYALTPPGGARRYRPDCRSGRPRIAEPLHGLAFLEGLGRALGANPPPGRDRPLLAALAAAGVGPGLSPVRAHLSSGARTALIAGVNATAAALPSLARAQVLAAARSHGGWATPASTIGDYGTDYTYRAGVAAIGLGANTPAEAVYPTAYTDSLGRPLSGARSYRVVFASGQLPPARAFWSMTLYDGRGFLVANSAHRFAIGSSHPPLVRRPDGSVVVIIARARPRETGINWLPEPAGQFRLTLRLYLPTSRVLSGAWQPPPVVSTP